MLPDADVRKVVKAAGGHVRQLDQPVPIDPVQAELFIYRMEKTESRYDVRFTPDYSLTNSAMGKRPVTVSLRGNLSKVHEGEFQKLHRKLRNPPRPRPAPGLTRQRR